MTVQIKKDLIPRKSGIVPQSVAAAGTAESGWVAAKDAPTFQTIVNIGALGGGEVALTFLQATSSGGAGSKALTAFATTIDSTDNTASAVDNEASALDLAGGFTHFKAVLTVTGGSGALLAVEILALSPRYTA